MGISMKRLVKNGKIILDGTEPLYVKEQEALEKLEKLEEMMEKFNIEDTDDLYFTLKHLRAVKRRYIEEYKEYHRLKKELLKNGK